jgi:hypothetical protein
VIICPYWPARQAIDDPVGSKPQIVEKLNKELNAGLAMLR